MQYLIKLRNRSNSIKLSARYSVDDTNFFISSNTALLPPLTIGCRSRVDQGSSWSRVKLTSLISTVPIFSVYSVHHPSPQKKFHFHPPWAWVWAHNFKITLLHWTLDQISWGGLNPPKTIKFFYASKVVVFCPACSQKRVFFFQIGTFPNFEAPSNIF